MESRRSQNSACSPCWLVAGGAALLLVLVAGSFAAYSSATSTWDSSASPSQNNSAGSGFLKAAQGTQAPVVGNGKNKASFNLSMLTFNTCAECQGGLTGGKDSPKFQQEVVAAFPKMKGQFGPGKEYQKAMMKNVGKTIGAAKVDVVFLQEVAPSKLLPELEKFYGSTYHILPGKNAASPGGRVSVVMLRKAIFAPASDANALQQLKFKPLGSYELDPKAKFGRNMVGVSVSSTFGKPNDFLLLASGHFAHHFIKTPQHDYVQFFESKLQENNKKNRFTGMMTGADWNHSPHKIPKTGHLQTFHPHEETLCDHGGKKCGMTADFFAFQPLHEVTGPNAATCKAEWWSKATNAPFVPVTANPQEPSSDHKPVKGIFRFEL